MTDLERLKELKRKKNAVILSHYYTTPEVQQAADFIGDSLVLSEKAATTDANIILFAGVRFMAETAKILSPGKIVLLVDSNAGCSLADSCPADRFAEFLKGYPDHTVISYVNTTSAVKALTDIVVTSSNAVEIVGSLPKDEKIVFGPDRNLGRYVAQKTGRDMVLWDGACHVHSRFSADAIRELKAGHPNAKVLAHPECPDNVLELSDVIGSTAALLKFSTNDSCREFIVATENGILHKMKENCPEKIFHTVPANNPARSCNDCEHMKLNTVAKMADALENLEEQIVLDAQLIEKAKRPIEKMLAISKQLGLI